MGRSLTVSVVFGVKAEKESLPWYADEWDGGLEEWWRDINGFKPTFDPFTEEGQYKPGLYSGSPEIKAYFDELRCFGENCPCPAEEMTDAYEDSDDCFLYIEESWQLYDWEAVTLDAIEAEKTNFATTHNIQPFLDFIKTYLPSSYIATWWVVPHYS